MLQINLYGQVLTLCTLAIRLYTVHVCKHTELENGALCNGQELGSTVNSFINLDEFETIKTLSGRRVLCGDEHQFRAKTMVSTQSVFEIPSLKTVLYCTVLCLAVFHEAFGQLYDSC